jgi:hypothetical protein
MVPTNHASLTSLYISTDFGATWNTVNLLTQAGSVGGFLKFADFNMTLDGSTIFVGFYNNTANYFLKSTDTGATWSILSLPYGSTFPVVAVGTSSDGKCLSAFYDNDHITGFADISADGGATWVTKSFSLTNKPEGSPGGFVAAWIVPFNPTPPPPPFPTPRGGYIIERLDNRIWPTVENAWCVDCGFTLAQPTPDADLQIIPVP